MAGRIPDQFIDELMHRVDIVDIIGERLELRRVGSNLHARCPFHAEKTPSFTVSPSKQFYHCFGCGAHGTAIRFLMEYDRMDFREAVEYLAQRVGMELPRTAQDTAGQRLELLYEVLKRAMQQFQHWLRQHPERNLAVDYLRQRGVSGEIAAEYGLGFAPGGGSNLLRALRNEQLLLAAGLAARSERGLYDRFRQRIMFPIRDRRGRVLGFGGRVLGDGQPKYLNSPETAVFHKGRELYGLYECLRMDPRPKRLIVVEGYMDVVALAQFGLREAVATLGTATSTRQVERLFQHTSTVVFCFDGDQAGRQAAWRALEAALPAMRDGRQAFFLFLQEGHDPDSLIRSEGVAAFEQRLQQAQPLSQVFFAQVAEDIDISSVDGRARLVERAMPGLRRLPPGIFRGMMLEQLAELAKVHVARLEAMLEDGTPPRPALAPAARPAAQGLTRRPIRLAIALLLQRPQLAKLVTNPQRLAELNVPGMDLFIDMVRLAGAEPSLNTAGILERFRDSPHAAALGKLAAWEHAVPDEGMEAEFKGALAWMERLLDEKRLQYLDERLRQGDLSEAELREWQELLRRRHTAPSGANTL
ncbi:MAG: DNA primase [Xanthomonadaceae bacterium]|nr:DNA primase [Xanthomonadaceae bacterium]